ncbi:MAG: peptidoglycan DD-metalloendopeptidase family protein [Bacteroidaceae bacterium]|nr:peptidoglycan DD-metalloendopeptidase family protein [Bacteroidaceae bacterium]
MTLRISIPAFRLVFAGLLFLLPVLSADVGSVSLQAQTRKKTTTTKTTTSTRNKTTTKQKQVSEKDKIKQQQNATKRQREQSQRQEKNISRSIQANLDSVVIISGSIKETQFYIDSINRSIQSVMFQINTLSNEISRIKAELAIRKDKYAKAMRFMQKNRNAQNNLMFLFSSHNFTQLIRRLRYLREYSTYQMIQGKMIQRRQQQMQGKQNELLNLKTQMVLNRIAVRRKQATLLELKENCQKKVEYLNRNLSRVQKQIETYKAKEADLDRQLEAAIQREVEAARKAAAEKKAREEAARKAAEAARIEKERQIAEAKAAKARAEAAKNAAAERIAAAERLRKESTDETIRKEAKKEISSAKDEIKKADADIKKADKEIKKVDKEMVEVRKTEKAELEKIEAWKANDSDFQLSSSFTANKGRLPMPITGSYVILRHYGRYNVEGLKNVTLDNKGIDVKGKDGAMARAIFNGEVSSIFQYGTNYYVMLRHGSYISVYSGLSSVSVTKGMKVTTGQSLGKVGRNSNGDTVLHFQLHKESTRLNPEQWIR